jgi:hypothetical protein
MIVILLAAMSGAIVILVASWPHGFLSAIVAAICAGSISAFLAGMLLAGLRSRSEKHRIKYSVEKPCKKAGLYFEE